MTEPTCKPRAKTRVKNLGPVKASLVAVSMALTVGGWAVLARDDSLTLSQSVAQVALEPSAPPTISAPPPTATPVPFRADRRNEEARRPTVQVQPKEHKDEDDEDDERDEAEEKAPRVAPTQVPTQPAPQPTRLPTQPAPTQPPAPNPPTVAPQPPAQPSAPSVAPRVNPPAQAPQPRARTRSSR